MTTYLGNAFSLSMLKGSSAMIGVGVVPAEYVGRQLRTTPGWVSAVGHESTAKVLTQLLGVEVPVNRIRIELGEDDVLYVFQLLTRLPEGRVLSREEVLSLPYRFYEVRVLSRWWIYG